MTTSPSPETRSTLARAAQRATWALTLWCLALYAGAEFATWIAIGPMLASLPAAAYVEAHQALTLGFKPAMPIVGAAALTGLAACAMLTLFEGGRRRQGSVAVAFALTLASVCITAIHNDGINTEVLGWTATEPPANWREVRAAWIVTNPARTLTLLAAILAAITALLDGVPPIVTRRVLERAIRIEAPASAAWRVLTYLPGHADWNEYAPRWWSL